MATTVLSNLINPQVMADSISATLPKKIKFSPIAKIDDTLAGQPGNTITVPKFAYIGDAEDVAEGVAAGTTVLTASTTTATVKKAVKAVELTDEAVLSGYGDPVGEASNQLTLALAAKVDQDCYDALLGASLQYKPSTIAAISYDGIVDANGLFGDESDDRLSKIMFIHPAQEATIRKDDDFIDKSKSGMDVIMTGTVGMVAGCQIVKSKKVRKIGYDIKAATATGYTEVTADNLSTYAGKYGVDADGAFKAVAVGQFVKKLTTAFYLNPIVVVDAADPNEDPGADHFANETPALTIYLKRNVNMEDDRDILASTTVLKADEHYTAVLSNDSKVVLACLG